MKERRPIATKEPVVITYSYNADAGATLDKEMRKKLAKLRGMIVIDPMKLQITEFQGELLETLKQGLVTRLHKNSSVRIEQSFEDGTWRLTGIVSKYDLGWLFGRRKKLVEVTYDEYDDEALAVLRRRVSAGDQASYQAAPSFRALRTMTKREYDYSHKAN